MVNAVSIRSEEKRQSVEIRQESGEKDDLSKPPIATTGFRQNPAGTGMCKHLHRFFLSPRFLSQQIDRPRRSGLRRAVNTGTASAEPIA